MDKEYAKAKRNKKDSDNIFQYGKIAPQAVELETAILGAMLIEQNCIDLVFDVINFKEAFYSDAHQRIFGAIKKMYDRGSTVDFMTVGEELKKSNELEIVGGPYYVTSLTRDVVSSTNVELHCRIVLEKYALRESVKAAGEIMSKAYDNDGDPFEVMELFSKHATNILQQIVRKPYKHISGPMQQMFLETVETSHKEIKMSGVPTGFKYLDQITGGWQRTDLIIIAARPSVGKTAFILNIIFNAAKSEVNKTAVGMFSLEMGATQLAQRLMSNKSNIELSRIKNGELNQQDLEYMSRETEYFRDLGLYIDDEPNLTISQLRAKAKKMQREHGVGLIVIDYLQLMQGDSTYRGNREQEISKISRDLKILAKEMNIPIIALSQMSRMVEGRSSNVPMLSDLRESGAIEQDADFVGFLYGNTIDKIKENPRKAFERHFKIAKHRNGRLADIVYDFDGAHQRFGNEEETIIDIPYEIINKPTQFFEPKKDYIIDTPSANFNNNVEPSEFPF
jgi:replicative DNA helicase